MNNPKGLILGLLAAALLTGCPSGQPAATPTSAPPATSSPAASPTAAETPADTGTPSASGEAPAAVVVNDSAEEIASDFENADGLNGFEEVQAMEVPTADQAMVDKGKELYVANCASCHGEAGDGKGPAGVSLDPAPRAFTAADQYLYGHRVKSIFRTGKYGSEGTGMVGWEGRMEDADLWAVSHYIRGMQK